MSGVALEQLKRIMPYAGPRAAVYLPHLNAAMEEFGIDTTKRRAQFLTQFGHETAQLATMTENLNYSAAGLMKTWPKRFPSSTMAKQFANNPVKIANYVYASRMGNGPPESGDGWRYRGAGGFQLTGKVNHMQCAAHFGIPVEQVGDWLRTPEGACRSAAWFWKRAGCNAAADKGCIDTVSDLINLGRATAAQGDAIGFKDRQAMTVVALEVLA